MSGFDDAYDKKIMWQNENLKETEEQVIYSKQEGIFSPIENIPRVVEQPTLMHIAGLPENSNGYLVSWHDDSKIHYDFISDDDVPPYPISSDKMLMYLESICPNNSKFARAYSKDGKVQNLKNTDPVYSMSDESKNTINRYEGYKEFANSYGKKLPNDPD